MALAVAGLAGLARASESPGPPPGVALVARDATPLRAAPRESTRPHTQLWQGELVEVRGEQLDHLQVYDHRRERGGFVPKTHVRRLRLDPQEAPELLAVLRFLGETPGAEALGIGYAAAYIQAATSEMLRGPGGIEALGLLGRFAERLAQRASAGAPPSKDAQARLSAHLDVAARYGVQFLSIEEEGRVRLCYDGDAFRRVLQLGAADEAQALAVLSLTRPDCIAHASGVERQALDAWRAAILDRVDATALPATLRNRVHLRRAGVQAALAFQSARRGEPAGDFARRALADIASVRKAELTDADRGAYDAAALRVAASRWAALAAPAPSRPSERPGFVLVEGLPGETCVALVDARHDALRPLARRCTHGRPWLASASVNREGTAAAIAVQPLEGWRELWVFTRTGGQWRVRVIPPAASAPGLGYAELAGWVPGGAQMLVAREALADSALLRSFEVVRLDTLATVKKASQPASLAAFTRWQDPSWKRVTLSLR